MVYPNKKACLQYLAYVHVFEFAFYVLIVASIVPMSSLANSIQSGLGMYAVRLSFGQQIAQIFLEYFLIKRFRKNVSLCVMFALLASLILCEIVWQLPIKTFIDLFIPQFFGGQGIAVDILVSQSLACIIMRKRALQLERALLDQVVTRTPAV